jgi:hypothetical protein
MASSKLSPKKYIETKARTLPIYKCFVNKNWELASEASVIVMRRHVNGNVTTGIYLVDLLCLGIKDTFYFFNEPEGEIYERFPADVDVMFNEVDYALAHNIIYAGHDFALDYGIEPHKEFAVTKFILEEDNDKIPLMDIPVGDEDGLPHLMVHQPGEYSSALAKLMKNAGEGNYRYTITGITGDDFDEDADEEFDKEDNLIENYDLGSITPREAMFLSDAELNDFDKGLERTGIEKTTLLTEQALRRLTRAHPEYSEDIEDTEDYWLLEECEFSAFGISGEEVEFFFENIEPELIGEESEAEKMRASFGELLDKYADKLLIVAAIFEYEFDQNGDFAEQAKSHLENLQGYPLAKLDLALANLLEPLPSKDFEALYQEKDIKKLFPEVERFGEKDLAAFWLIQTLLNVRKGDLQQALLYYYLFAETDTINFLVSSVQIELIEAIDKALAPKV